MIQFPHADDRIVITGIGMITSVGKDRESTWQAMQRGDCGMGHISGLRGFGDTTFIGAAVDLPEVIEEQHKPIRLAKIAAAEAVADAKFNTEKIDPYRVGCAIAGHMGDSTYFEHFFGLPDPKSENALPWWRQWLPNSACSIIAHKFGFFGPRLCNSTACASSLISVLSAVRSIQNGLCDAAIAGGGDAIDPMFAAGFKMRALSTCPEPKQACRPFDRNRTGFVMGEGAGMVFLERLSHAQQRGAKIYAEILGGKMLAEAHHVTGLDDAGGTLSHLIDITLENARLEPGDIGYINAHGTGTTQNDKAEARGIRESFGADVDRVCISSTKSMIGHLVNAAGAVELATTVLAMRDGFAPPTINLTDPDPECDIDCLPLIGRENRFQHALKLSVAFGGHLVAVALKRWNDAASGFGYPDQRRRAA